MLLDYLPLVLLYNKKRKFILAAYSTREEAEAHFEECIHKEELIILQYKMFAALDLLEKSLSDNEEGDNEA